MGDGSRLGEAQVDRPGPLWPKARAGGAGPRAGVCRAGSPRRGATG